MKKMLFLLLVSTLVSSSAFANRTLEEACGKGQKVVNIQCEGNECVYTCKNGEMFSLSAATLLEAQNQ